MKYCKQCLTTSLRPNAQINSNGICIACEHSDSVIGDGYYTSNLAFLKKLIAQIKSSRRNHASYDCIIGVSGGKDSTRQAHWVRDRLGLHPLLVSVGYPPLQMSHIGAKNLANLIEMGFDVEVFTPSPQSSAHLLLAAFRKFGNMCKSTEMTLHATVPRVAIEKKIPLIFWGENPALQVGDARAAGKNCFDGNNLRYMNTLIEGGFQWVLDEIPSDKTCAYRYPGEEEFEKAKINIIYLGMAWDDWGSESNSVYAALNGLMLRPNDTEVTGDISGASMLDEEFSNINMMIKYFKFGFGRATDICNEYIRSRQMTREEAVAYVNQYDGICDDSLINKFCHYVNIDMKEFWSIVHQFTNKDLFFVEEGKRPEPKFEVGVGLR